MCQLNSETTNGYPIIDYIQNSIRNINLLLLPTSILTVFYAAGILQFWRFSSEQYPMVLKHRAWCLSSEAVNAPWQRLCLYGDPDRTSTNSTLLSDITLSSPFSHISRYNTESHRIRIEKYVNFSRSSILMPFIYRCVNECHKL